MQASPAITLSQLVSDFAVAMTAADALRPQYRTYMPGIGPHHEDAAVRLTLMELRRRALYARLPSGQSLAYTTAAGQRCDMWLGDPPIWAVEVKMARFKGNNNKLDDMALKDLLSPYEADHSALTDFTKLARDPIAPHRAVIVYGFDYPDRPLDPAIDALELLARQRVALGPRATAHLGLLVHPVHRAGRVFGWEVGALL